MRELPKVYEPQLYEDAIYKKWEESGLFNPDVCVEKGVTVSDAEPFSIVLPPPNVTGTLHMGHAAMLAIEDVMVRYHRMKGDKTLWVPGTDHAAIATQSKVEKLVMEAEGKSKYDLGRAEFLKRVEKFAQESHDTIVNQCKKMGASLDWSREAYTLDEQRNLAVRTVFKKMYEGGLIYRGYRVINWSVRGQSTISDDEIVYVERPAKLYYFKYSQDFPITIATTRPETKLGDTAVAVNPKDKRYKKYIGKEFVVDVGAAEPLKIKIIADENIDPEFGTGALGVTPAHSMIDFQMYQKESLGNGIGLIQVIGEDGKITTAGGINYQGLSVVQAREKFIAYLRENNLLEKEEDIIQNVGTSDRFGDVVEPLPKLQWFINVNKPIKEREGKTLKQLMQDVVKSKQIEIIPDRFEKTYFDWIDNLRDWCISRQLWYGHRIPVWYCGAKEISRIPFVHDTVKKIMEGQSVRTFRIVDYNLPIGSKAIFEDSSTGTIFGYGTITNAQTVRLGELNLEEELDGVVFKKTAEIIKRLESFSPSSKINKDTLLWIYEYVFDGIIPKERCGSMLVSIDPPKTCPTCGSKNMEQDPDTLDTWFSAGLWTFSTLGYPDLSAEDLKNYHPTSVLETGYDIIFFWVARMILMTTYTLGEVPFKTVYLHGLVRDEQGRKMSKSLDNIINPLDMIAKYGTDATRLSLLLGSTPGNDMKLSEEKIAGFRNFTNKLWNISRFMLLNIEEPKMDIDQKLLSSSSTLADCWILDRLERVRREVTDNIEKLQFSYAGEKLRDFTWGELADWYLEIAKIEGNKDVILNYILNTILKLWHPFMPFVTETIWQEIYGTNLLMVQSWPSMNNLFDNSYDRNQFEHPDWSSMAEKDFAAVQAVIIKIRALRSENNIEPGKKLVVYIKSGKQKKGLLGTSYSGPQPQILFNNNKAMFLGLARLEDIRVDVPAPSNAVGIIEGGIEFFIDLAGALDIEKEKPRLEKEIAEIKKYIGGLENKLANKEFIQNAPKAVIEKEKEKLIEAQGKLEKLTQQLENLK